MNSRGATAIEAGAVMVLLLVIFTCSLRTISIGVARIWLEHCLYSAVRCELIGSSDCKSQALKKIKPLSWGKIEHFYLQSHLNYKQYKITDTYIAWCNSKGSRPCNKKDRIHLKMQMREKDLADLR